MSLLLRHRPEVAGLTLDAAGWVSLDELITSIRSQSGFGWVDEAVIRAVVANSEKRRFEIAGDPARIRATYGHSISIDVEYERVTPPAVLYHGTTRRAAPAIRREGLKSMQRHHVFLTETIEEAESVGRRRDPEPVVLAVDTDRLINLGYTIFQTPGGLYLTDYVPPEAIRPASI